MSLTLIVQIIQDLLQEECFTSLSLIFTLDCSQQKKGNIIIFLFERIIRTIHTDGNRRGRKKGSFLSWWTKRSNFSLFILRRKIVSEVHRLSITRGGSSIFSTTFVKGEEWGMEMKQEERNEEREERNEERKWETKEVQIMIKDFFVDKLVSCWNDPTVGYFQPSNSSLTISVSLYPSFPLSLSIHRSYYVILSLSFPPQGCPFLWIIHWPQYGGFNVQESHSKKGSESPMIGNVIYKLRFPFPYSHPPHCNSYETNPSSHGFSSPQFLFSSVSLLVGFILAN